MCKAHVLQIAGEVNGSSNAARPARRLAQSNAQPQIICFGCCCCCSSCRKSAASSCRYQTYVSGGAPPQQATAAPHQQAVHALEGADVVGDHIQQRLGVNVSNVEALKRLQPAQAAHRGVSRTVQRSAKVPVQGSCCLVEHFLVSLSAMLSPSKACARKQPQQPQQAPVAAAQKAA
jgi:hypothetical protein